MSDAAEVPPSYDAATATPSYEDAVARQRQSTVRKIAIAAGVGLAVLFLIGAVGAMLEMAAAPLERHAEVHKRARHNGRGPLEAT